MKLTITLNGLNRWTTYRFGEKPKWKTYTEWPTVRTAWDFRVYYEKI